VADTVGDEVESSSFVVGHGTEGVVSVDAVTEGFPSLKGFVFRFLGLSGDGAASCVLTRAEIMEEAVCDGRLCRDQGIGC
jgi:hypothetical protein